jgi:ubiquinone/menaquinone biosynthesis C-methylase UbiE
MARRLDQRASQHDPTPRVLLAPGESLPIDDDSIDTVVSTLVLCTVDDVDRTLGEVRRILAPGGRLLFLEHVRSEDPRRAKWQDRLHRPWKAFGHGCNCNRDTVATLEQSGFRLEDLKHGTMPKAPPIVRPLVTGVAVAL